MRLMSRKVNSSNETNNAEEMKKQNVLMTLMHSIVVSIPMPFRLISGR